MFRVVTLKEHRFLLFDAEETENGTQVFSAQVLLPSEGKGRTCMQVKGFSLLVGNFLAPLFVRKEAIIFTPLDNITLFIIDERLGAIRRIAHAATNGADPPDEIIPLPEGMLEKITARNFSAPFIVDAEQDDIFRVLGPLAKIQGNTDLIIPLRIRGGRKVR